MARKKKPLPIFHNVTITDIAAEGKSLVRITIPAHDGTPETQLVVFVPFCVPGDVVDLQITKKKHSYAEAKAIKFHKMSEIRTTPPCQHFGTCGGCKWQQLPYEEQLKAKQQQVYDQLTRIGHLQLPHPTAAPEASPSLPVFLPILGSKQIYHYRNKLDFACSNRRYLTKEQFLNEERRMKNEESAAADPSGENSDETNSSFFTLHSSLKNHPAIGFHVTGAFDKVLPITECWLMDDLNNQIRNEAYDYALQHGLSFFDLKAQTGLLRDIIIRNSNSGEWMVILQFHFSKTTTAPELNDNKDNSNNHNISEQAQATGLMEHLANRFPQITSLLWVDNPKCNDTFGNLPVHLFKGNDHIFLEMEGLRFKVGPKSFYQTNTNQAYELYKVVRTFAFTEIENSELALPLVYDLYTGTGTIANFVARHARKVIGIEYVPEAIEDAKVNSQVNHIDNTLFFAGDMKDILTDDFIAEHGRPDIIITDPPRAGMHPDVVNVILQAHPQRIVYVSCNPATQARDLALLCTDYRILKVQPVDMFPHTPHVENVVLLCAKE